MLLEKLCLDSFFRVDGIISEPVFYKDKKVAIWWRAIGTQNDKGKLAELRENNSIHQKLSDKQISTNPKTTKPIIEDRFLYFGKWRFDKVEIMKADQYLFKVILQTTAARQASIVFVDEIGPLELNWKEGFYKSLLALDKEYVCTNKFALISVRPDISVVLKQRWPDSQDINIEYGRAEIISNMLYEQLKKSLTKL